MNFTVNHTFHRAARHLINVQRQVRFAAAGAINDVLFQDARPAATAGMQVFDRPTPFTQKSVRVEKADRNTLTGSVFIPTTGGGDVLPAGKPLMAEVHGGPRRFKRSEKLLQAKGILPRGYYTVPGPAAEIDVYGNQTRRQILHLLAYFETFGETARSGKRMMSNTGDKGREKLKRGAKRRIGVEYFVVLPGHKGLRAGIYMRQVASRRYVGAPQRVRAVLFFVTSAQYKRLYAFHADVRKAVMQRFEQRFQVRFAQAMATARAEA